MLISDIVVDATLVPHGPELRPEPGRRGSELVRVDEHLLTHLYGTRIRVVHTAQGDMFTRSGR